MSYADLMTLLFATFVVLYGIKPEGETVQLLGVVSSIREAFVEIPDDIPLEQRKGPLLKGKAVFKYFRGDSVTTPLIKKYRRAEFVNNVVKKDLAQIQQLITELNRKRIVKPRGQPAPISVREEADGIRLRILATFLYKPGEYRVNRSQMAQLEKIGKLLKDIGRPISIEGHTDPVPEPGGMSTWDIAALRATHLGRFLINKVNFPGSQLSMAGYGTMRRISEGSSAEEQALNRRVEIKVHYGD